ncbi:hypothetical protein ACU21_08815 [Actinobaculum suis]|nr:hypothetical protein ACU21_08815 [Actinobaculum suis]OCA95946.1 hypothetical protein ACU20_03505 [Actinobaculum suis]
MINKSRSVYLNRRDIGSRNIDQLPHRIYQCLKCLILAREQRWLMEDIDDVSRAQENRIDLDLAEEGLGDLLQIADAAAGEAYADKGVDLQVETITDTARVLVDRQRFGQVMSNLLSNALRHTSAGGQVWISVHRQ